MNPLLKIFYFIYFIYLFLDLMNKLLNDQHFKKNKEKKKKR